MRARSGRRVKYADLGDGACWGGPDAYAQEGLDRLTDPELVDEHGPEGIELVVADAYGNQDQGARVVEGTQGAWPTISWSMRAQRFAAASGLAASSARASVVWASIRRLQNALSLTLAGLSGRNERQVKSGSMKSDGAGKSWYQVNSPICTCIRESPARW